MVSLYAGGREYIHATITDAPDDVAIEVSPDHGATWHPTERIPGDTGDTIRFLAQGPDAPAPDPGTNVLTLSTGRTVLRARAVDHPEILIRDAGYIDVRSI